MGDLVPLLQAVLSSNGLLIIAALVVAAPVSIAIKAAFPEQFWTSLQKEEERRLIKMILLFDVGNTIKIGLAENNQIKKVYKGYCI